MGGEESVHLASGVEVLEQGTHRDLGAGEYRRPVSPFRPADDHLMQSPHPIPPDS
jgi:hypothetical protein